MVTQDSLTADDAGVARRARRQWEIREGIVDDPLPRRRSRTRPRTPAPLAYVQHLAPRYHELKGDVQRVLDALHRAEQVLVSESVVSAATGISAMENPAAYQPAAPLREIEAFVALASPSVSAISHDVAELAAAHTRLQIQSDDRDRLRLLRD